MKDILALKDKREKIIMTIIKKDYFNVNYIALDNSAKKPIFIIKRYRQKITAGNTDKK